MSCYGRKVEGRKDVEMKTVKEIKEFRDKHRNIPISVYGIQRLNQFVFDALISITERIEAQGEAFPFAMTEDQIDRFVQTGAPPITDEQRKDIERAAMIRVLEWQCKSCGKSAFGCGVGCHVPSAIVRLREGGEL